LLLCVLFFVCFEREIKKAGSTWRFFFFFSPLRRTFTTSKVARQHDPQQTTPGAGETRSSRGTRLFPFFLRGARAGKDAPLRAGRSTPFFSLSIQPPLRAAAHVRGLFFFPLPPLMRRGIETMEALAGRRPSFLPLPSSSPDGAQGTGVPSFPGHPQGGGGGGPPFFSFFSPRCVATITRSRAATFWGLFLSLCSTCSKRRAVPFPLFFQRGGQGGVTVFLFSEGRAG